MTHIWLSATTLCIEQREGVVDLRLPSCCLQTWMTSSTIHFSQNDDFILRSYEEHLLHLLDTFSWCGWCKALKQGSERARATTA